MKYSDSLTQSIQDIYACSEDVFTHKLKVALLINDTETCVETCVNFKLSKLLNKEHVEVFTILVYYCKCCDLIGYSTFYLFLDRERVEKQSSSLSSYRDFFLKYCFKIKFFVEYFIFDLEPSCPSTITA